MISINPTLLRRWYKYIQHISFGGFSAHSRVSDSISYNSLQLANQSTSQLNNHVSSTSLVHLSWMEDATVCLFKFPKNGNVRKRCICHEKFFFPLTLHTSARTQTHSCSVEKMSEGAATHARAPQWAVLGVGALLKGTSAMPRMWTSILQLPVHIILFSFFFGLGGTWTGSLQAPKPGANPESDFTSCILSCPCNVSKCYCI